MMPKQLPDVRTDKGYRQEAADYAKNVMTYKLPLMKSFQDIQTAIEKAIYDAYLKGANSAIMIGYRLAEEDYKETITYYKKQIEERSEQ